MAKSKATEVADQQSSKSGNQQDDGSSTSSSEHGDLGTLTSEAAGQVRDTVSGVKDQVRQQALGQVTTQKERAADGLEMVVGLLRQAGQQVSEQDKAPVAASIDGVADQVEQWSETLRTQDVSQLVEETKELARRQPALFVGGALVAGFLSVRFFRSSPQGSAALQEQNSSNQNPSSSSDTSSTQKSDSGQPSDGEPTTAVLNELEELEGLLLSSKDEQANEQTQ